MNPAPLYSTLRAVTMKHSPLAITAIFLVSCFTAESPQSMADFIHGDSINHKFLHAGRLRDGGQFGRAAIAYDSLLQTPLKAPEAAFARANMSLCLAMIGDTTLRNRSDSANIKSFGSLTEGILSIQAGKPDLKALHEARHTLTRRQFKNTIYYLLCLEHLGIAHRRMGAWIDSARMYTEQAISLGLSQRDLRTNLPRLYAQIAVIHMMNRDAVSALSSAELGLAFETDADIGARLLLLQAAALRKLGRLGESKEANARAEKLVELMSVPELYVLLLREQALHALYENSDDRFLQRVQKLTGVARQVPAESFQPDQLYGYYYFTKGENRRAIIHYERSLAVLRRQALPDPVLLMEALNALAHLYLAEKQFDLAERTAFDALVAFSERRDSPYTWKNITHPDIIGEKYNFIDHEMMARIYLARYAQTHDAAALDKSLLLYNFIDSTMQQQIKVIEEDAVLQFTEVAHSVYSGAIEAAYYAYQHAGNKVFLERAHQYMERSKALVMYRDVMAHDEKYFPEVSSDFRDRELRLKSKLAAIKKSGNRQALASTLAEFAEYYRDMEQKFPRYYQSKYQLSIPSHDHYSRLAAERRKSILQYHIGRKHLYVLKYGDSPELIQVDPGADFIDQVANFRAMISRPMMLSKDDSAAARFGLQSFALFERLIRPLGDLRDEILIIPEGILNQIPFECLVDKPERRFRDMNFLVEAYDISYGHSLKTLEFPTATLPVESIFGMAFTREGEDFSGGLPPLPGAIAELKAVDGKFSRKTLASGSNASRKKFFQQVSLRHDVVHLAMHASSNPVDYLDNRIYFRSDDGVDTVYGFEIAPLRIQAHTVVLTACESAFGATVRGEGTFSLARAFRQAGAQNVISSLWNLADFSSVRLTADFYELLKNGATPSQAIGGSKRKYLDKANEITASPYYWASLVCYGF